MTTQTSPLLSVCDLLVHFFPAAIGPTNGC